MKMLKSFFSVVLMTIALFAFSACSNTGQDHNENTGEIEEAAEETGEDIEKAAEEAGDEIEEGAEDLTN